MAPRPRGFAASYGSNDLDASLLQMAHLRFLPLDDPRLARPSMGFATGLSKDGWLFRYHLNDGFGSPTVAFIICTFWLVEALADTGRRAEARNVMDRCAFHAVGLGLLAEDYEIRDAVHVGQLPASVLPRRADSRGVCSFARLGRRGLRPLRAAKVARGGFHRRVPHVWRQPNVGIFGSVCFRGSLYEFDFHDGYFIVGRVCALGRAERPHVRPYCGRTWGTRSWRCQLAAVAGIGSAS